MMINLQIQIMFECDVGPRQKSKNVWRLRAPRETIIFFHRDPSPTAVIFPGIVAWSSGFGGS